MIVALDLATRTGVAVGAGGRPNAWSVDLGAGQPEDAKFSRVLQLTHSLIDAHAPDLIAIEAPVGGPEASHFLIGLVACVRGYARNRGVPVARYQSSTIRKHFLGAVPTVRGQAAANKHAAKKAIKGMVMNRCRALGYAADDDDAADACALWDYATALRSPAQAAMTAGMFGAAR